MAIVASQCGFKLPWLLPVVVERFLYLTGGRLIIMPEQFLQFSPQAIVDAEYKILLDLSAPPTLGARDREQDELLSELRESTISIAPFTNTLKIPNDKLDASLRDDNFEYYKVETGMNINVPTGKIKELRFFLSLYADGKQGGVHALDGFPNDKIKEIPIVGGEITIGINGLLKLMPFTQPVAGFLDIKLNPWKFNFTYKKLDFGFTEGMTDEPNWYVSSDYTQSFNCYITLKKSKTARDVYAFARAIWMYEPKNPGISEWLKRRFGKGDCILKSDMKSLDISLS
jgi:hypothetical protein